MAQALSLDKLCNSGHNPKEWEKIPIIQEAKPKKGYVEISLQRLDLPNGIDIVLWMGAKNGFWYPASGYFLIKKKFASHYSPSSSLKS